MLCYFYYISPLLFQKWGMVKAGHLYLEWEFGFRRQSSSGSLPVHINFSNSSVTVLMWKKCWYGGPDNYLAFRQLVKPIFQACYLRERGLTGSWKIWHCCLQENEHFTGWVATQQQMVDLNKNSIHSLFCHFLVFLLILSMFNHFN